MTSTRDYHLTAEEIAHFDEHGYVILRDRIPGPLLEKLQRASDRWIADGHALTDESAGDGAPSAGAAKTKTISCSKLSGNAATKIKASGCTGNTGGTSKKMAATVLAGGGTIKWANGKTTTIGAPSLATGSLCPAGDTDVVASGTVTADTTGSAKPIPGLFSAEVCVDGSGNISLAPGTKMTAN